MVPKDWLAMMSVYMKAPLEGYLGVAPKDWLAMMPVYMKLTLVWPLTTGQP